MISEFRYYLAIKGIDYSHTDIVLAIADSKDNDINTIFKLMKACMKFADTCTEYASILPIPDFLRIDDCMKNNSDYYLADKQLAAHFEITSSLFWDYVDGMYQIMPQYPRYLEMALSAYAIDDRGMKQHVFAFYDKAFGGYYHQRGAAGEEVANENLLHKERGCPRSLFMH